MRSSIIVKVEDWVPVIRFFFFLVFNIILEEWFWLAIFVANLSCAFFFRFADLVNFTFIITIAWLVVIIKYINWGLIIIVWALWVSWVCFVWEIIVVNWLNWVNNCLIVSTVVWLYIIFSRIWVMMVVRMLVLVRVRVLSLWVVIIWMRMWMIVILLMRWVRVWTVWVYIFLVLLSWRNIFAAVRGLLLLSLRSSLN